MDDDRRRGARQVMVDLDVGDDWFEALDPDSPAWLRDWTLQTVEAWRAGDLDWVLEYSHPEIEIVQPHELPDARTYNGRDGVIEALLDWPREWEDFQVEATRIFAVDDERIIVDTIHRGRSLKMGIEVEAPIVWLFTRKGDLTRRWDMFTSVDRALEAARADE